MCLPCKELLSSLQEPWTLYVMQICLPVLTKMSLLCFQFAMKVHEGLLRMQHMYQPCVQNPHIKGTGLSVCSLERNLYSACHKGCIKRKNWSRVIFRAILSRNTMKGLRVQRRI